jgi:hypothetical protein
VKPFQKWLVERAEQDILTPDQKVVPTVAHRVKHEFDPENLGDWFYNQIVVWSESEGDGSASVHVFRKTTLQYARKGEDVNRLVASDANVTTNVMMTNYVHETDEEYRQKSNRTFRRIAESLPPDVAERYGHVQDSLDPLKQQLQQALASENWELAQRLTAELAKRDKHEAG